MAGRTRQVCPEMQVHTSSLQTESRAAFCPRMKTAERALLVVDDDSDIRETLAEVLRDDGRTVTTATDGFDALQKLAHLSRPCLILLDLMMPRMSGLDFLTHLQARADASDFEVVVMSAHDALRREAQQRPNVRATVGKPFDVEQLLLIASGEPLAAAAAAGELRSVAHA